MAKKRQIQVERISEPEPPENDMPSKYRDEGWSEWFRGSYARWWFALLCMIVDLFLALEIARYLSGSWLYLVPLVVVIVLVLVEIYLYHLLWGGLDFLFGNRRLI